MKTITQEMKSKEYGDRTFSYDVPETVQESVQKLGEEKTLAAIHRGLQIAARGKAWGEVAEREQATVEVGGKKLRASKGLASEVEKLRAELARLNAAKKA